MGEKELNTVEIWKDILGYEGIYQVSNLGNVRCLVFRNNRYCINKIFNKKLAHDKKGYVRTTLTNNGVTKYFLVHRLVAQAFLDNPNNLPLVNHKDENPTNNNVNNLEWCTAKYNFEYSNVAKRLAKYKKKKINQYDLSGNFIKQWECMQDIQRYLNISKQCILYACKNKTKNTKGYIWRYANE